jgi:K+-sensing histidine kinase KdpD
MKKSTFGRSIKFQRLTRLAKKKHRNSQQSLQGIRLALLAGGHSVVRLHSQQFHKTDHGHEEDNHCQRENKHSYSKETDHWLYYVISIIHYVTISYMLHLLCTLLLLIVLYYLYYAVSYRWLYVTSIMYSSTAGCTMLLLLCSMLSLVVYCLYYVLYYRWLHVNYDMYFVTHCCMLLVTFTL